MSELDKKIVDSFDGAALRYDATASLQKQVAAKLMSFVRAWQPQNILDLGCGTGLVTAYVHEIWPAARLTAVDAAPSMVRVTRQKIPAAQVLVADASQIPFQGRFDLIVSSMMLHWLAEPVRALEAWKNLLAPRGHMAVALPVEGSLSEWKNLCRHSGVVDRLWPFPRADLFSGQGFSFDVIDHPRTYESASAFLKNMKDTGADKGHPAAPPMPPAELRRVLRSSPRPFTATYRILYLRG